MKKVILWVATLCIGVTLVFLVYGAGQQEKIFISKENMSEKKNKSMIDTYFQNEEKIVTDSEHIRQILDNLRITEMTDVDDVEMDKLEQIIYQEYGIVLI